MNVTAKDPARALAKGDALVVVDVQNDFCPDGSLPIEQGDRVVPVLNRWIRAAASAHIRVYATRDWHPLGHPTGTSFATTL